jgi:hypothetical protein
MAERSTNLNGLKRWEHTQGIKIQLEYAYVPEAEIRLRRLKRRERPIPKELLQARTLEDAVRPSQG